VGAAREEEVEPKAEVTDDEWAQPAKRKWNRRQKPLSRLAA